VLVLEDALDQRLCGHGPLEAVAGGQVDGLQRPVDGPSDRRAVAPLRPGRQVEVARALGEPGSGRHGLRIVRLCGGGR
jgi:hypothetical protein